MIKKVLVFLGLFGVLLLFASCTTETFSAVNFANSIITIDINPSFELKTDESGMVIQNIPINEDAQELLKDLDLTGLELEMALDKIVELAKEAGYLDFDIDNAILVSIYQERLHKQNHEKMKKQIRNKMQESLRKQFCCGNILYEEINDFEELKEEASQFGISVGKLKLINEITEQTDLTFEDLVILPIKELLNILNINNPNFEESSNALKKDFNSWVNQKKERNEEFQQRKQKRENKSQKNCKQ